MGNKRINGRLKRNNGCYLLLLEMFNGWQQRNGRLQSLMTAREIMLVKFKSLIYKKANIRTNRSKV